MPRPSHARTLPTEWKPRAMMVPAIPNRHDEAEGDGAAYLQALEDLLDGVASGFALIVGAKIQAQICRQHGESAGIDRGYHADCKGESQWSEQSKVAQVGARHSGQVLDEHVDAVHAAVPTQNQRPNDRNAESDGG